MRSDDAELVAYAQRRQSKLAEGGWAELTRPKQYTGRERRGSLRPSRKRSAGARSSGARHRRRTEFASHLLLADLGLSDVPLRERLDAATNERLDRIARAAGLDPAGLQAFRPWVAGQIVRHATYAPLYAGPTMDETLADMALRHGATVRTEFTADTVIRMFGEMSVEVEADMLRFELDSLEPGPAQLRERYVRGINGNLAWDEAEAFHVASAYPELFDVILRHRNLAWGPRIDEALRDRVATFIAVGTLHLVGPDNVLSLLRDEVLPV